MLWAVSLSTTELIPRSLTATLQCTGIRSLADVSHLVGLRGAARDLRLGSGLTANRINLPYASELYPAFNISSLFSSTSALL